MIFLKALLVVIGLALSFSCSTQSCKIEERPIPVNASSGKSMTAPKDLTARVRVYKQDGSEQCGTGKKLDPSVMQKELESIEVFSVENKHDGMMRIQMCGHPTGNCNIFEIPAADLDKALKLGFKKWLRD